jgi:hypothetical protein
MVSEHVKDISPINTSSSQDSEITNLYRQIVAKTYEKEGRGGRVVIHKNKDTAIESEVSVEEFLQKCRDDLAKSGRLVQGCLARTSGNIPCNVDAANAVGWDSVGIMQRNCGMFYLSQVQLIPLAKSPCLRLAVAVRLLAQEMAPVEGNKDVSNILKFHDSHALREILQAWDRAIAVAARDGV